MEAENSHAICGGDGKGFQDYEELFKSFWIIQFLSQEL